MTALRVVAVAWLLVVYGACAAAQAEPQAEPVQAEAATPPQLLVDHAWVRDAGSPDEQGLQQRTMKLLREKVLAGGSFVASWEALGVDGTNWHVAERESYPLEVMPEEIRALPEGTISAIVAGDGGLHLFRVIGRE